MARPTTAALASKRSAEGKRTAHAGKPTKRRSTVAQRYSIIYADPPWAYLWGTGKDGGNFAPEKHYPTMSTEAICAMDIRSLRNPNCVLALWATAPCLPDAFKVLEAWGFKYKTVLFVWVKLNPRSGTIVCGPGSYTRSACEYLLLGMRGHIKRLSTEPISQVLLEPRTRHSAKPNITRKHLVSIFGDLPRLELFARTTTVGWDVFGNEVSSTIKLAQEDLPSPPGSTVLRNQLQGGRGTKKAVAHQKSLFETS